MRSKLYMLGAALLLVLVFLVCWTMQPVFFVSKQTSALPPASPQKLEKYVRAIVSNFGPRDSGNPQNLKAVADFLQKEFEALGLRTALQEFRAVDASYYNVSAFVGPETSARVVIGAHYDTADSLPGADDNASGVAGILELARILSKAELQTQVELVAFSLEEPPFFATLDMGSAVHAQSLLKHNVPVKAMISVEMIGYFSDAPGSQQYPLPGLQLLYPPTGNFIAVVSTISQASLVRSVKRSILELGAIDAYSINGPRFIPGIDFSDHRSYLEAGYPAVMITDTAFCRNLAYHTADDTPDRLDYRRMAQVVDGIAHAVPKLAR